MSKKNTFRLNFIVSEQTKERLDLLVDRSDNDNMTEVVRKALRLYDKVTETANSKNKRWVLQQLSDTGEVEQEETLMIL